MHSHGRYGALAESVFEWIQQPGGKAVTSVITLTELLVPLYRQPGSLNGESPRKPSDIGNLTYLPSGEAKASEFILLLTDAYPNLEWIPTDFAIAELAARYRARYGLKTPDALHAATAVHAKATGFVTNDASFNRVKEFETLQFEKLL